MRRVASGPSRIVALTTAATSCLVAFASSSALDRGFPSSTLAFSSIAGSPRSLPRTTSPNRSSLAMTSSSSRTSDATDASATNANNDPLIQMNLPSPLILGSGSFTRKLILKEMGINYELVVRPIDEKGTGDRDGDPATLVSTLAKAKGDHLVSSLMSNDDNDGNDDGLSSLASRKTYEGEFGGWIVLTADQVVTHDGAILEKPESIEEARDFVRRYADAAPRTVGACVLTHMPTGIQVTGVDSAQINFRRTVSEGDLVGTLLEDNAPVLSCAGGLMVEHPLVKEHISGIDGTEDSVMGLSKDLVLRMLAELKERLKNAQNA